MQQSLDTVTASENNLLAASALPLFFEIGNFNKDGMPLPVNRHGQSVRVWARSLTVMQKEAIVWSDASQRAWRLASDEGPYLQGSDYAPCPLSFLTTGMLSAFLNAIQAVASQRGVNIRDIELVQQNYYGIEGSVLRGTIQSSAMPPELEVRVDCEANDADLQDLVASGVRASPVYGLMRHEHKSLFTLSHNGREIDPGKATALGGPAFPDPRPNFDGIEPAAVPDLPWARKVKDVKEMDEADVHAGASLKAEQKRTIHLQGRCRLRADGVKEILQDMFRPAGSTFCFLSDELQADGGPPRAPEAAGYISAGIAFCFMTQIGRYAKILKKSLEAYDVVQDTHFSAVPQPTSAGGGGVHAGIADPVETHLYITSKESDNFARQCLDMGEQTCFLHALCRTALQPKVRVKRI